MDHQTFRSNPNSPESTSTITTYLTSITQHNFPKAPNISHCILLPSNNLTIIKSNKTKRKEFMNKLLHRPPTHPLSKNDKKFFKAIHEAAMRYYTTTKAEILKPLDKESKHLEFITRSLDTLPQVQKNLLEKDTLEGDEAQMSDPVYRNLKEGVEDFLEGCMGDKEAAIENVRDVLVEGRKRLELAVATGYTEDVRVAYEDWKRGQGKLCDWNNVGV